MLGKKLLEWFPCFMIPFIKTVITNGDSQCFSGVKNIGGSECDYQGVTLHCISIVV
jgi:hypothetical protein